jgi:uncharacterized protein (TIGR02302 family)
VILSFQLKINIAKLALYWERLWRLALPFLLSVSGIVSLGLFGVFERIPPAFHMVILLVFGALLLWSLMRFTRARWPQEKEALRWLEISSGHSHRPASSLADTLSLDADDPATKAIWQAHQDRLIPIVEGLKPGIPQPKLIRHDPYSLRALAFLVVFVATFSAGPDWRERLDSIASPGLKQSVSTASVDAWITPPRYTGKAPVFLTGGNVKVAQGGQKSKILKVPENSELVVRISGVKSPQALVTNLSDSGQETIAKAFDAIDDQTLELRLKLAGSRQIDIRNNGISLSNWQITVIPDTPPVISLNGEIKTTADQTLIIAYSLKDDYGVTAASALFTRKLIDDNIIPPFARKPPDFTINLPGQRIRKLSQSAFQNLTAHPWAGRTVTLRLKARDDAGQVRLSDPITFTLPTRKFTKPLAQAIAEQRAKLASRIDNRHVVAVAIDALTLFPEEIVKDTTVYLGLRTAYYRLTRDDDVKLLAATYELLWDLALRVEDGDLSLAERELRAAQEALRKALANNASPEEIEALMQDMKKALGRFLQALNEKNQRLGENNQLPQGDRNQEIKAQDLAKILETIENLAKSGANDAAQKMLSELQNLLESLQAGGPSTANSQDQSILSDMIQELGNMINQQQRLLDDTFKSDQNGDQNQGNLSKPNSQNQTLADKQQALRDLLGQMMQQLGQNGMEAPSAFNRAGEAMQKAEGALREGEPGKAVGKQGTAIDQLRQGAQSMAQRMMDGLAQRQGLNQRGQNNGQGKTDPLGRPLPNSGPDYGMSTKIPAQVDIQRARELRRELQNRIGEPNRPQLELEYLDRLLRRF